MEPTPRFRIQAVAEATGLSTATLRAWERRYGIPSPARGDSGYRLYSQRDLEMVRRMVALGERGVAPSEAAHLVTAEFSAPAAPAPPPLGDLPASAFEQSYRRLLAAIEHADLERLERYVQDALTLGPAWTVYRQVFEPTLVELGERWAAGAVSVGQERATSQVLSTTLRNLVRLVTRPKATRRLLLACVTEEQHELPLLGVALLGATLGWRPYVLGSRTPPDALQGVVTQFKPDRVGLSITIALPEGLEPRALFAAYAAVCGDVPWIVGGRAAHAYAAAVSAAGGQCLGQDVEALRLVLEAP
jgi:DNA-binding transcriptional MerR regulator